VVLIRGKKRIGYEIDLKL
jgi:hypothetical protein